MVKRNRTFLGTLISNYVLALSSNTNPCQQNDRKILCRDFLVTASEIRVQLSSEAENGWDSLGVDLAGRVLGNYDLKKK